MIDQQPSPRVHRRLLMAGAGVGSVLVGLLLLGTVFSGGEVAVGVTDRAGEPVPSTTVPVLPPGDDMASVLALTDPFDQLATVPEAALSAEGGEAPPASGDGSGVAEGGGEGLGPSGSGDSFRSPGGGQTTGVGPAGRATDEGVPAPAPPSDGPAPPSDTRSSSTSVSTAGTPPVTLTTPPSTSTPPTTATTTVAPARGIAFTSTRDGNQEIYAIDPDGRGQRRLTDHAGADRHPAWSPDGTKLAFVSDRAGRPEVFVMAADGASPTRLTEHPGWPARPTWAGDGQSIAFESTDATSGNRELFLVSLKDGALRRLTSGACAGSAERVCPEGDIAHRQPAFSPDGSRIAFIRVDRAGGHVLVVNADGSEVRWLGGTLAANPAWAAHGGDIAYDDIDGIRVVSANGGDHVVVAGTFRTCRQGSRCPVFFEPSWSPDGTRLAVRALGAPATTGDIYVIDLRGQQRTRLNSGLKASTPKWFTPSSRAHAHVG